MGIEGESALLAAARDALNWLELFEREKALRWITPVNGARARVIGENEEALKRCVEKLREVVENGKTENDIPV